MAVSIKEVREKLKLSPERQEKIAQRSHQLIQDELTLRDFRNRKKLVQIEPAESVVDNFGKGAGAAGAGGK